MIQPNSSTSASTWRQYVPSIAIDSRESRSELAVTESRGGRGGSNQPTVGMKSLFDAKDNCDETFLLTYH